MYIALGKCTSPFILNWYFDVLYIIVLSFSDILLKKKSDITQWWTYLYDIDSYVCVWVSIVYWAGTYTIYIFRVVPQYAEKEINGHKFVGFGSHSNNYPCSYLTAAAAVGMTTEDVDLFIKRLNETFKDWKKKMTNKKEWLLE